MSHLQQLLQVTHSAHNHFRQCTTQVVETFVKAIMAKPIAVFSNIASLVPSPMPSFSSLLSTQRRKAGRGTGYEATILPCHMTVYAVESNVKQNSAGMSPVQHENRLYGLMIIQNNNYYVACFNLLKHKVIHNVCYLDATILSHHLWLNWQICKLNASHE